MRIIMAFLFAVALSVALPSWDAEAEALDGVWSGGGHVSPKSGQREKVSCRVQYQSQGSKTYGVVATCATTSAKIVQTGSLTMVNPTRYVGDFYNSEYNVSGRVRVVVSGSRQTVTFWNPQGSGQLSLSRR